MRKPKTIRGFMKLLLEIAGEDWYDLKGADKLSEEEWQAVGALIAGMQNELGEECDPLLERFGLIWRGDLSKDYKR